MFLRVKRFKTTVFLECTPKDKIEDLRKKLAGILKEDQARIRLMRDESNVLPEQKTVAELGLKNEEVIFVVFTLEGGAGWEKINIPPPEVVEDDDDDDEEE